MNKKNLKLKKLKFIVSCMNGNRSLALKFKENYKKSLRGSECFVFPISMLKHFEEKDIDFEINSEKKIVLYF